MKGNNKKMTAVRTKAEFLVLLFFVYCWSLSCALSRSLSLSSVCVCISNSDPILYNNEPLRWDLFTQRMNNETKNKQQKPFWTKLDCQMTKWNKSKSIVHIRLAALAHCFHRWLNKTITQILPFYADEKNEKKHTKNLKCCKRFVGPFVQRIYRQMKSKNFFRVCSFFFLRSTIAQVSFF